MALTRTAKSCGSDAPMLASSLREEAQATVSNKPGHRGEHEGNRKTIARGMPGRSGVTVVTTLVCFTYHLHARLRAHRAPGIPCALCNRRTGNSGKPRVHGAARSRSYVCRHCEERKRRSNPFLVCGTVDCFASLAMTVSTPPNAESLMLRRELSHDLSSVVPAKAGTLNHRLS